MSELIYKQGEVDISADGRKLSAILSKFGNIDEQNEIMCAGCMDAWMTDRGNKPLPMLKGHDIKAWPLGVWDDFKVTDEGLRATGTLALEENEDAVTASKLIRKGLVTGVSVGFAMIKGDVVMRPDGTRGRNIRVADLKEASLTPFRPANPEAVIEAIDGENVEDVFKSLDVDGITRKALSEWRLERVVTDAFARALRERNG